MYFVHFQQWDSHEFRLENGKLRYVHTITLWLWLCPLMVGFGSEGDCLSETVMFLPSVLVDI